MSIAAEATAEAAAAPETATAKEVEDEEMETGVLEQIVITAYRHKRHVVSVTMHDVHQPNYSYQDRFVVRVDGEAVEFLTLFDGEREAACAAGACVRSSLYNQLSDVDDQHDPLDDFQRLVCGALASAQENVERFQARIDSLMIVMLVGGEQMAIARTGTTQCVGVASDSGCYQLTGVSRPIDRSLSVTCALEIVLRSTSDLTLLVIATDKLWDTLEYWTIASELTRAAQGVVKANKIAKMLVNRVCDRAEIDRLGLLCYSFAVARGI